MGRCEPQRLVHAVVACMLVLASAGAEPVGANAGATDGSEGTAPDALFATPPPSLHGIHNATSMVAAAFAGSPEPGVEFWLDIPQPVTQHVFATWNGERIVPWKQLVAGPGPHRVDIHVVESWDTVRRIVYVWGVHAPSDAGIGEFHRDTAQSATLVAPVTMVDGGSLGAVPAPLPEGHSWLTGLRDSAAAPASHLCSRLCRGWDATAAVCAAMPTACSGGRCVATVLACGASATTAVTVSLQLAAQQTAVHSALIGGVTHMFVSPGEDATEALVVTSAPFAGPGAAAAAAHTIRAQALSSKHAVRAEWSPLATGAALVVPAKANSGPTVVVVDSDIVVANGGSLHVRPGTVLAFAPGAGIKCRGSGSSVTLDGTIDATVVLTTAASGATSTWAGVAVADGCAFTASHAFLGGTAAAAVHVRAASALIQYSVIEGAATGVDAAASQLQLIDTVVSNVGAVVVATTSSVHIARCRFAAVRSSGVHVTDSTTVIQDTSLAAIGGTAIVVTTSLTLEDSSTPSLSVVGTLVERCGRAGVLVRSSGPAMSATVLVVNSTIVGCQVGIDMRADNTSAVYVVQSVLAANKAASSVSGFSADSSAAGFVAVVRSALLHNDRDFVHDVPVPSTSAHSVWLVRSAVAVVREPADAPDAPASPMPIHEASWNHVEVEDSVAGVWTEQEAAAVVAQLAGQHGCAIGAGAGSGAVAAASSISAAGVVESVNTASAAALESALPLFDSQLITWNAHPDRPLPRLEQRRPVPRRHWVTRWCALVDCGQASLNALTAQGTPGSDLQPALWDTADPAAVGAWRRLPAVPTAQASEAHVLVLSARVPDWLEHDILALLASQPAGELRLHGVWHVGSLEAALHAAGQVPSTTADRFGVAPGEWARRLAAAAAEDDDDDAAVGQRGGTDGFGSSSGLAGVLAGYSDLDAVTLVTLVDPAPVVVRSPAWPGFVADGGPRVNVRMAALAATLREWLPEAGMRNAFWASTHTSTGCAIVAALFPQTRVGGDGGAASCNAKRLPLLPAPGIRMPRALFLSTSPHIPGAVHAVSVASVFANVIASLSFTAIHPRILEVAALHMDPFRHVPFVDGAHHTAMLYMSVKLQSEANEDNRGQLLLQMHDDSAWSHTRMPLSSFETMSARVADGCVPLACLADALPVGGGVAPSADVAAVILAETPTGPFTVVEGHWHLATMLRRMRDPAFEAPVCMAAAAHPTSGLSAAVSPEHEIGPYSCEFWPTSAAPGQPATAPYTPLTWGSLVPVTLVLHAASGNAAFVPDVGEVRVACPASGPGFVSGDDGEGSATADGSQGPDKLLSGVACSMPGAVVGYSHAAGVSNATEASEEATSAAESAGGDATLG